MIDGLLAAKTVPPHNKSAATVASSTMTRNRAYTDQKS